MNEIDLFCNRRAFNHENVWHLMKFVVDDKMVLPMIFWLVNLSCCYSFLVSFLEESSLSFLFFYLVRCPTSYIQAQCTRLHRILPV